MKTKTELLDLFEKYLSDPVSFSDQIDDFKKNDPALAERFSKFSSILEEKYIKTNFLDETLSKINEQLLQYAQNNFSYKTDPTTKCDSVDSLISSMNSLGEEINNSTVSRHYFTDIFNAIPDYVLIVNNQGIIENCNHSFSKLYNDKRESVINHSICELFKEDYSYKELLEKIEERTHIMQIYLDNNMLTPVSIKLANLNNSANKDNCKVFIFRDISQILGYQQKIEKSLKDAQESDYLKLAFLTNMSHEIRTPMNGILGFTELLKTGKFSKEKELKFIDIIQQSSNRMLNTVSDIIDVSRIQAGQMTVIKKELNIVDEIYNLFESFSDEIGKKGLNLRYECKIKKEQGIILCDKSKMSSILTHLIKNAIKFTDTGDITITCDKEDNSFVCSVKDTGIGIPKNRQEAIFDPFVHADIKNIRAFQGCGLGLTITQSYIKMLNGSLHIDSDEGKGSTFTFRIPWQMPKLESDNNEVIKVTSIKDKKWNILIVEDETVNYQYLVQVLDEISQQIHWAKNGIEAINYIKTNRDINLVLMDIKMPVMGGYEATREIRKIDPDLLIIAQTAYALPEDRKRAIEAGCDDYISKPINRKELLSLLNKHATL